MMQELKMLCIFEVSLVHCLRNEHVRLHTVVRSNMPRLADQQVIRWSAQSSTSLDQPITTFTISVISCSVTASKTHSPKPIGRRRQHPDYVHTVLVLRKHSIRAPNRTKEFHKPYPEFRNSASRKARCTGLPTSPIDRAMRNIPPCT